MKRFILPGALVLGACVAPACSDANKRPSLVAAHSGGTTATSLAGAPSSAAGEPAAGGTSDAGGDGSVAGAAGALPAGAGGSNAAGQGGASTAGTATNEAGSGVDPLPPLGDPPICTPKRGFAAGVALGISGAGDDLLQAITADELHIAWKNGDSFYVADRATDTDAFGPPAAVLGGAALQSVTLASDGLTLLAIQGLQVLKIARDPGAAFDVADANSGDFELFNGTLRVIPIGGQNLRDAVVNATDSSFFFTYFLNGDSGSYPTVQESRRAEGSWEFASRDLGKLLYAQGEKHRIPSGVSADALTLFYRDQVNGDFRAAWRVNTMVQFNYSEVLGLAAGVTAAAPNGPCSKLYFSAPGAAGLDLFVSSATP